MSNKKKNFLKTFACFSLLSLSTTSIALATKNTQDFTNVITFGDSFVDGHTSITGQAVDTHAKILTEKLGFAFTRNKTNFAAGGHSSANMVGGTFGTVVYNNSDLDNYLTQKGKFGSNDIVIYAPLSSEVAGLYDPVADASLGGIGLGFFNAVFTENLAVITGNPADVSDVDLLMARGAVTDQADTITKVLNNTLALNSDKFPVLFRYLGFTEANTQSFMQKASLNGANYIIVSNHYNEAFRQDFLGLPEEFIGVMSQELAKAQLRGHQKYQELV